MQDGRLAKALELLEQAGREIEAAAPLPSALDLRARAGLHLVTACLECARRELNAAPDGPEDAGVGPGGVRPDDSMHC